MPEVISKPKRRVTVQVTDVTNLKRRKSISITVGDITKEEAMRRIRQAFSDSHTSSVSKPAQSPRADEAANSATAKV
jgi:hypothetical protein